MRRKARWNRIIGAALIVGAVILTSGYAINNSNAEVASPKYGFVEHVVAPGETLWSIAGQYAGEDEDVREVIYEIKTDNDLDNNAYLQKGQVLKIRLGNKK